MQGVGRKSHVAAAGTTGPGSRHSEGTVEKGKICGAARWAAEREAATLGSCR